MTVSNESHTAWFGSHIRHLLTEALETGVVPDDDGDFPVHGTTARGWVRPICGGPWGVQIVIMAAHQVPDRVAVLRELNDVNSSDMAVRVARWSNGTVAATCFLLAEGLVAENLVGAVSRTIGVADGLGPMLVAVHGGQLPVGSASQDSESDA